MPKPTDDRLISVREVSRLTSLDAKTIYAGECGTDELIRIPLGKRRIAFSYNDTVNWIETRKRKAEERARRSVKVVLLQRPMLPRRTINAVLQAQREKRTG